MHQGSIPLAAHSSASEKNRRLALPAHETRGISARGGVVQWMANACTQQQMSLRQQKLTLLQNKNSLWPSHWWSCSNVNILFSLGSPLLAVPLVQASATHAGKTSVGMHHRCGRCASRVCPFVCHAVTLHSFWWALCLIVWNKSE